MQVAALLVDGFGRLAEEVGAVVPGLDTEGLHWRWEGEGNSIAWLVWHLTRIQDDHVAAAFGQEQIWLSGGWQRRFALPLEPRDTGYGHSSDEVAAVRVDSADLLLDYFAAVQEPTLALLAQLRPDDLDRVVDTSWDPPVTLGVRLISVLCDGLQHIGQAALVKGLLRHAEL
jgi:hypothetical protein